MYTRISKPTLSMPTEARVFANEPRRNRDGSVTPKRWSTTLAVAVVTLDDAAVVISPKVVQEFELRGKDIIALPPRVTLPQQGKGYSLRDDIAANIKADMEAAFIAWPGNAASAGAALERAVAAVKNDGKAPDTKAQAKVNEGMAVFAGTVATLDDDPETEG